MLPPTQLDGSTGPTHGGDRGRYDPAGEIPRRARCFGDFGVRAYAFVVQGLGVWDYGLGVSAKVHRSLLWHSGIRTFWDRTAGKLVRWLTGLALERPRLPKSEIIIVTSHVVNDRPRRKHRQMLGNSFQIRNEGQAPNIDGLGTAGQVW